MNNPIVYRWCSSSEALTHKRIYHLLLSRFVGLTRARLPYRSDVSDSDQSTFYIPSKFGLLMTTAAALASPGHAQEAANAADVEVEAPVPAGDVSTVVYDQLYFADYDVQNAQDMLRRIPGVSSILSSLGRGSSQRGFGSGGGDQILLNGRRFPGKSNDTSRALSRLRADRIERVELIRGGRPDIDVQSTGLIVNIVLREGATLSGGGTFEAAVRGNEEGALGVDGLATYSSSIGRLGYNLGIERSIWQSGGGGGGPGSWSNRFRDEIYFYPDGPTQELRPQFWDRDYARWVFNGGLTYDLPGGARAQLNGLYETVTSFELNETNLTRFNDQGVETDRALEEQIREIGPHTTLEVSGEFTSSLAEGNLTILMLANLRNQPTLDFRTRTRGVDLREISRSETDQKQTEIIGRLQYSFPVSGTLGMNIGAEVAQNKLQQDLVPYFDVDDNGTVEPVVIPTANARVDEIRGEAFIDAQWNPNTALSATASVNYEYSELSTNSIFNSGRNLGFFKPRLDVRYSLSDAGVLRALVEKEVSQLDFDNFVPRFNFRDDRIDAGNPGLLPEKIWNFELGYEHRLPNDLGVVSAELFYEDITDPIDAIPLLQGVVLVSAQGNLDHATSYGAEAEASIRLVPLGLRDAVLTVTGELQKTRVTDPFTGRTRRLENDSVYEFMVGYRHDVRSINLSYGFDYRNRGKPRIQSDLFSRDVISPRPSLSLFAEKRLSERFSLRAETQNIMNLHERRDRTIYAVNQLDGLVRRLDRIYEYRDVRYALILKGTF